MLACCMRLHDMNGYLAFFYNIQQLQRNLNLTKIKTDEARCSTPDPDRLIKLIHRTLSVLHLCEEKDHLHPNVI